MIQIKILSVVASATALAGLTACGAGSGSASADDFPSKRMSIVVPYPAGGGLDIAARALAPCLEKELGQNVIVENKDGGSGAVGTTDVLGKPADGLTLEMILTSAAVVTPLTEQVGYSLSDLQPVGQVAAFPYVIVVTGDSPYKSLEELLASDKGLKAASPGAASQGGLELEAIKEAGAPITLVPFDGTAGVKTALLGGDVDFGTAVADEDLLKQHKAGTLRILGVTSAKRADYLPDVPAINEIPGYEELGAGTSYFGLVVRSGTPDKIISTLDNTLKTCIGKAEVKELIGTQFVSETYVDGSALQMAFEEQSKAYSAVVGK